MSESKQSLKLVPIPDILYKVEEVPLFLLTLPNFFKESS